MSPMSPPVRIGIPHNLPGGTKHGTTRGWNAGCRCEKCYSAKQSARRIAQTTTGRRGGKAAALGPPSIPFIHGDDRLSRLRRLRDKLSTTSFLYKQVCARIVDIEVGDVDNVSSNFLTQASVPQTANTPKY